MIDAEARFAICKNKLEIEYSLITNKFINSNWKNITINVEYNQLSTLFESKIEKL